ncbi:MAG: response regulator transcription factor [Planctomycetota bacterium]
MIRIVIAEDHTLVREGLCRMLSGHTGFEVVGEAKDGLEAQEIVAALRPDILVLDISMPNLGGLEAARHILRQSPSTRIIVLSMHEEEEFVLRALREGVSGYVVKASSMSDLVRAICTVTGGHMYLSPSVTSAVVERFLQEEKGEVPQDPLSRLTPREIEVLKLVAEGKSSKEIGALLNIGQKTVETHRANLSHKMDLKTVADMVRFAVRHRLVEP